MNRISAFVALLLVGWTLAGCGDSSDDDSADSNDSTIEGAWARTSPSMASAGAAYFTITSPTDDSLLGVSVDPSIAADAQIHETAMADSEMADDEMDDGEMDDGETADGEMADDEMAGVMQMREIDSLELPAGTAVVLEPGGYHIMLIELVEPLEVGQTLELALDLADGPDQVISVPVRDEAPAE